MASGKTTVAEALAHRFPRSVHVHGDHFRQMIVNGQAPMSFELSEDARAQLMLRYAIAVQTAKMYSEAGYTVVYQDIILGSSLAEVISKFVGYSLSVVVLCPSAETVSTRETNRGKSGYRNRAEIAHFDRVLRDETPKLGFWLDSSALSPTETLEAILKSSEVRS